MKIELTEKEALEIYSKRYLKSKGKLRYLLPPSFLVALLAWLIAVYFSQHLLGVGLFALISTTGIFLSARLFKASQKYARGQIEGIE